MSDLRQRKPPQPVAPPPAEETGDDVIKRRARESVLIKRIEEEAYEFNHPLLVVAFILGFTLLSYVGSQSPPLAACRRTPQSSAFGLG